MPKAAPQNLRPGPAPASLFDSLRVACAEMQAKGLTMSNSQFRSVASGLGFRAVSSGLDIFEDILLRAALLLNRTWPFFSRACCFAEELNAPCSLAPRKA